MSELLPCPFCGGPVDVEETRPGTMGQRFWGVKCRNTLNVGGTCAIEQIPSGSRETAIARWNARAIPAERVLGERERKICSEEWMYLRSLERYARKHGPESIQDVIACLDHLRANQGGDEHE